MQRISHPPAIQATFTGRKTMRFKASSALTNVDITQADLLDLVFMALTATTGDRLFNSMRLRYVEIWGPMASDLVPVTVSIEYVTGTALIGGRSIISSDTSMGSSQPAHVRSAPAADALANMWFNSSASSTLVRLNGPTNSVVDVNFEYALSDATSGIAITNAPVGATAGTVYYGGLDGLRSGSTQLPPVSLPTN